MNHNVKLVLKWLKGNETRISMFLGAMIVLIAGYFFLSQSSAIPQPQITQESTSSARISDELEDASISQDKDQKALHTISAGEHLWSVAELYYNDGYKWVDIMAANSLADPDLVTEGQELIIPDLVDMPVLAGASTPGTSPDDKPDISDPALSLASTHEVELPDKHYTVNPGDHLWKIAELTLNDGYRWYEIWEANREIIDNPSIIEAGWRLEIPV